MLMTLITKLIAHFFRSRDAATQTAEQQLAAAKRELQQAEKAIRRAPNKAAKKRAARHYQSLLQKHEATFGKASDQLKEVLAEIEENYAEDYEAFEEEPPRSRKPRCNPAYEAKTRAFLLAAIIVALSEALLAFYQFRARGYDLFSALFIAGFATLAMVALAHGMLAASTRHTSEDKRELLLRVLWLALLVTILPLTVFFLFRSLSTSYLPGFVLILLQPVNDVALWLATLGLIPTGAAFLGLSLLYGWSGRWTRRYEKVRRLKAEIDSSQQELLAQAYKEVGYQINLTETSPAPRAVERPERRASAAMMSLGWCLALGLPTALTGCSHPTEQNPLPLENRLAVAPEPKVTTRPSGELHILIDGSQSPDLPSTEQAIRKLHAQLGETVQATGVERVSASIFDVDSWQALEKVAVDLPRYVAPTPEPYEPSKLPPHLEAELRKRYEARQAERVQQARAAHAAAVKQALTAISLSSLLPPAPGKKQPRCSDIRGGLQRAAQKPPGVKHYWIWLSDARHSCGGSQMKPVGPLPGESKALLLWVPVNARESRGQRAEEQYAERVAALRKVAPWLLVQRADEGDPVGAFTSSLVPQS